MHWERFQTSAEIGAGARHSVELAVSFAQRTERRLAQHRADTIGQIVAQYPMGGVGGVALAGQLSEAKQRARQSSQPDGPFLLQ